MIFLQITHVCCCRTGVSLYRMLFALYPFDIDHTPRAQVIMNMSGRQFAGWTSKKISYRAKTAINQMLDPMPSRRLVAENVDATPFCRHIRASPDVAARAVGVTTYVPPPSPKKRSDLMGSTENTNRLPPEDSPKLPRSSSRGRSSTFYM